MALTVSSANGLPLDVLSRIAEDATVGFALVTVPDWRMIYANPAFRQLVGIGQDLAGRTLSQVFPAAAEDITDLLAAPAHTGRTLSRRGFPLRISPDRPETWWDFDLIPLPGPAGTTKSVMVITREVTDHVLARREAEQARAALHASEERLRLAMAAGKVYCWDWDLGTGQVTWSDGLEAAMLIQPGGFGGTLDAFRALVHPDDRDRIAKALDQALAGAAPYDVQFRMIRADGSVRWTATRATVLHDDAGKPTRVVGIDVDISQFKETEAALRNSEMLLRATLDSAPVGVSIIDRDLRFIHVNRHLAEADGVPADAYPGRTVQDVLGELGERLAPIYERVLETGTSVENLSIAGVLRDTPDTKREWLASYHPVRTSEGEVVALNAVVAEITGQRETEQRLSDAQDLLRSVIESVSDSVTVRDLDGRFVFLNKAAARRLGTDPDQALGRTTQDILPSDLLAHINRHLEQVMRTGLPAGVEETISLGGVTRIYHTVRSPWRDAAGMLRGVITVARDITDRKRTEQVLADANRELERRIAERTRALGDAARDLEEEIKQRVEAQSMLLQAQKLEALG
ncbi:MAG: PAS domain-containing protein, partial [Acetobacteraceae bacterium]